MRGRRPSILAVALAVLLAAGAALTFTDHRPRLRVPAAIAIRDVQRDVTIGPKLRRLHFDRTTVTVVDAQTERVSFYAGSRIVAEVAVSADGRVAHFINFEALPVPYGNWLGYEPAVLLGLGTLFVLMAGVLPLRRMRNLDAVVAISLVAPVPLLQHRYVAASVLSAVPGLVYLMVRLAWRVLGPERQPAPSRALIDCLTARLMPRERVRLLRMALAALVFMFLLVGTTSPNAVDVVYAVMEGATKLVHGVLPYGHLPGDVVHGDTYPLLSYGLYAPLAFAAPVNFTWDSVDIALAATAIVAVITAGGLFFAAAGRRGRAGGSRPAPEEAAGLRAAIVWLSFPPLLLIFSTGTTDVVLAAMLLFAVLLWRRPGFSAGLVGIAGWFKLAPFVLVPVWLAPLRGRRLVGALWALVAISLLLLAALVALGGSGGPASMVHAVSYQFTRGSEQSLASSVGAPWLGPVAQAATLSLLAAFTLHFWRRPAEAERDRMAAAAGALMIAMQLGANYWAFLYLVWAAPSVALTLFDQRAVQPVSAPVRHRSARWRAVNPVPSGE
jgi:hypothetical protein